MTKVNEQVGEATTVVIGVLVVALIGALGFIFWQNFNKQSGEKADNAPSSQKSEKQSDTKDKASEQPSAEVAGKPQPKYINYEQEAAGSGVKIINPEDVNKLEANDDLKQFLANEVTKTQMGLQGEEYRVQLTIKRTYGSYAVGVGPNYAAYWGPRDGSGEIALYNPPSGNGLVESCSAFTAVKFPPELVDHRCVDANMNSVEYKLQISVNSIKEYFKNNTTQSKKLLLCFSVLESV